MLPVCSGVCLVDGGGRAGDALGASGVEESWQMLTGGVAKLERSTTVKGGDTVLDRANTWLGPRASGVERSGARGVATAGRSAEVKGVEAALAGAPWSRAAGDPEILS